MSVVPSTTAPPTRFVLGGPLRAALGLGLWTAAIATIATAHDLGFGLAWTALVPAVVLIVPASALLRRRVLRWERDRLLVEDGWLWRRAWALPLSGGTLEVVPTAGLRAVVLHRQGQAIPLATWIAPTTAIRLADWLDRLGPEPLPRIDSALPAGDR